MEAAVSNDPRAHETTVISQPSEVETQVSRIFRAPVERVFHIFTDPATLPAVWSPDPSSVTIEQLEFRPGGRYSIQVRAEDGSTMRFFGEFREIVPPRRVVNTWHVTSLPGVEAVETDEFEPVGSFTRLTIRWKYSSRADRDKMGGPEMEVALNAMWANVDRLLAQP